MTTLARRVTPLVASILTSARTRDLRRWLAERRRRLAGRPHQVLYFHQVDDPYSQLAAQVLPELLARYDVELVPHLVGPPSDAAAPERERLAAFSRRDAADVAPGYGLTFPPGAEAPVAEAVELASRTLAAALAAGSFVSQAAGVGAALWSGDRERQLALARELGTADLETTRARVTEGDRLRERLGHYLGATCHYAGEWYWGVDRLHHLERRLRGLGLANKPGDPEWIAPRPDPSRDPAPPSGERLRLEYYPSLRSPYTAIVMDRVLALPERLPVDLVLRPVLPMVMRGLPVPRAKLIYITLDSRREAEDAGVAFGRVCDPIGRPVERCFSLFPWAKERGRGAELLRSFTQAAFQEGRETGTDDGLRFVVERAGLSWEEALAILEAEEGDHAAHLRQGSDAPSVAASTDWREELEANREQLAAIGLWGVPSFRLLGRDGEPDYSTWGQDRLWRVEQEIRRRLGS
ncbi:MAG: 2-hydroxychromene-2-carboxylate isomerase [Myxococcota bacterium]